jgi:UDP-glucose 4-epimerase
MKQLREKASRYSTIMNKNSKVKVLVTGGAGFIGSHLCEKLHQNNQEVYSLDNYSTGSTNNHINGVEYITGHTKYIGEIIKFAPDVVYHLGEYSRVERSFEDIDLVWNSNVNGIFAVLQFCRKIGAKLIYAGSSTRFADAGLGGLQSPYAWTKSANAELVERFGNWFGLKYAITYFYNVYGGREISSGEYATLIGMFTEKYKKKEPLTVVSPGTQRRNFTHIDDIISGLILVGENGNGDDYGIGSSESFSINDIASAFGSDVEMLPERKGNRMDGNLVCEKTKELGWKETKSVMDYINSIVNEKCN